MSYTKEEIEDRCWEDYERHAGKVILASRVVAMIDHGSVDVDLDPPIRLLVDKNQQRDCVISWNTSPSDNWCDPNWDVSLLEPHPVLEKASSIWVSGISRSTDGTVDHSTGWKLDEKSQLLSRYYVERCCWSNYEAHAGKFLLVKLLHGFLADCNQDFGPSRPVRVRVIENQRESDVLEWHEAANIHDVDCCNPYWDVELAEPPFDNETAYADEADRLWVMAPHMTIMGDHGGPMDWEVDPDQAPLTGKQAHYMPAVLTTRDREAAEAAINAVRYPKQKKQPEHTDADDVDIACPHCGQSFRITIEKVEKP